MGGREPAEARLVLYLDLDSGQQMFTEVGQRACPMGDAWTVIGLGDPE